MTDVINIDELIDRMDDESITYTFDKCSLGEQFRLCLPMKSNFIDKLNIKIVFYDNGNLEYQAKVPIIFKEAEEHIALKIVNEMNYHNQITSYYLEGEHVAKAKYIIKTNGVVKVSSDYILSTAFHFAETIDDSLCRTFCK